jgi:hypothetical protein
MASGGTTLLGAFMTLDDAALAALPHGDVPLYRSPVEAARALEDLLVRLSVLADAHPEVTEVDCDPVLVSSAGAVAVDARIHIRPTAPRRPFPALDR